MLARPTSEQFANLLAELSQLSKETEWVEFKHNNDHPQAIGEYISALSNAAALSSKPTAYMIWGIADDDHALVGTDFRPSQTRIKQQELESWLLQKLIPKIHFQFIELAVDEKHFVMLEIAAANQIPIKFESVEYIRIGSYKKKLHEFPEKERALWRHFDHQPFEQQLAATHIDSDAVLKLLDYPAYFDMTKQPLPEGRQGVLAALLADHLVEQSPGNVWAITNLGAILFAKNLRDFRHLARKSVRIILYKGNSRIETIREQEITKGYAIGFEGVIDHLKALLPSNEQIGQAFRREVKLYPELALRELVANAIIHQDFTITGTGPMIELFENRLEITNPGIPLVDTQRFLDTPPQSRNESLASFMRRLNICEERGSGIDKVVSETEIYQLPAPLFEKMDTHTRSSLFAQKNYQDMDTADRVRACYLHCCLKYVNREPMNNTSLRQRFKFDEANSAMASRVIKQTVDAKLIRLYDINANRKAWRYVPYWA